MTRVYMELMYGDYTIWVTVLVQTHESEFVLKQRALEAYQRISGADAPEQAWILEYEENV